MDYQWNAQQQQYPAPGETLPLHLVLPPGWMSVIDPVSGKTYYANPSTGQTSWEPPLPPMQTRPPPPPPPPPPPTTQLLASSAVFTALPSNHVIQSHQLGMNSTQHSLGTNGNGSSLIANNISTLQTSVFFLPAVRNIVECATESNSDTTDSQKTNTADLEFPELSSGVIADLVHVQLNYREQQQESCDVNDDKQKWYYESLKPMDLPIASRAPHIESGRVDIRLMSLMDELKRIEKQ